jgi:hypothetical protein
MCLRSKLARHLDGTAIVAVRQRAIFFLRHIDELVEQEIAEHERDRQSGEDDHEPPGREMLAGFNAGLSGLGRQGGPGTFLFHYISAFRGAMAVVSGPQESLTDKGWTGFTSATIPVL